MTTTAAASETAVAGETRRDDPGAAAPFPPWLYVPAALGVAVLALPLLALLVRLDWTQVPAAVASPAALQALTLSLVTAAIATAVCIVLGVPLAVVIARSSRAVAAVLRTLTTLPLVLPPLVGGIALLALLGRNGLFGETLGVLGLRIPFTTTAVVIAQTFVALPFLVVAVEGAIRSADARLEDAAATLGASRWYVFRRVTLPLVAPGVGAGAVLCFARALGEFGATITFAGSLPGVTRTMPVAVYLALETDPDAAIVLSLVLLVVSLAVLLGLRERWVGVLR
jgi:molybdate transport system permease protein